MNLINLNEKAITNIKIGDEVRSYLTHDIGTISEVDLENKTISISWANGHESSEVAHNRLKTVGYVNKVSN
ncbi:MAG: hypothetical protein M0R77_00290 [Gammaproteobacteria bacterium]|nr:hypothetical protein [Acholeplasmataceae bacterium]MCK9528993.1 hypothetical protein [Gammaproteobacteria bacterium]